MLQVENFRLGKSKMFEEKKGLSCTPSNVIAAVKAAVTSGPLTARLCWPVDINTAAKSATAIPFNKGLNRCFHSFQRESVSKYRGRRFGWNRQESPHDQPEANGNQWVVRNHTKWLRSNHRREFLRAPSQVKKTKNSGTGNNGELSILLSPQWPLCFLAR